MSLRDDPDSHKIIVPRVAGLSIIRAYDVNSGGIGGPGVGRTSIDGDWVSHYPVDPVDCDTDKITDEFVVAHFDALNPDSLVLVPLPDFDENGDPIDPEDTTLQREVMVWRDSSGRRNHAYAVGRHYPHLALASPFLERAVAFKPACDTADPDAEDINE